MPKARLQYAIVIDAALAAEGATDPVVRVYGARRGRTMPFVVRRGWSGPQGAYVEEFRIVHAETRVTAYRSHPHILEMAGEFYTDELVDTVVDVELEVGEYQLVFTVDDEAIPGVPVFVEPGPGAPGGPDVVVAAIVDEAMKKSDIVWYAVDGLPGSGSIGVWHLWHEGADYAVFDGSEQKVPGLADADTVVVISRSKDKGGRIVAWRAAVDLVDPGTGLWEEVTPLLVGKRLNNRDGDEAPARWARECKLARLTPTGEILEDADNVIAGNRSAPPAPSTAATETRIPITLHKVKAKKK